MSNRTREIMTGGAWLIVTAMVIYATWLLLKRFTPTMIAWLELLWWMIWR